LPAAVRRKTPRSRAEEGAARDLALFNAAAAIVVAGKCADLAEGVGVAREAIDSGAAARVLARVTELSRELAPA
jgi:anthranilate phosphoribosyltransferase